MKLTQAGPSADPGTLTMFHKSDQAHSAFDTGNPGPEGILGAKAPRLGDSRWRWFYTQQHGDNPTYEVVPAQSASDGEHQGGHW